MAWGGEESGRREAGGGISVKPSTSSSLEGASEAGMVASDEGSKASEVRVIGFVEAFEAGAGGSWLGQLLASLDIIDEPLVFGPDDDVGRREALSLTNWDSIPASMAQ